MLHNGNKTSMAKPSMVHELLRNPLSVSEGTISENPYLQQVSQNRLLSFYQAKKRKYYLYLRIGLERAHSATGVTNKRLIPFDVIRDLFLKLLGSVIYSKL